MDEDELTEPEFVFADTAFRRRDELDFDEEDLERIILTDMFVQEMNQSADAGPDEARVYRALGWTRSGHHIEVIFSRPYYGGGIYVFHAMPYPRR